MPLPSADIISNDYRQYIKHSLITQAKEGKKNLDWLRFYKQLSLSQQRGDRSTVFLKRSLAYLDMDETQIPNFVTGEDKPPLAFPRKFDNPQRRKIKSILSELRAKKGVDELNDDDVTFDFNLNRGLTEVIPFSSDGEIRTTRKRRRKTNGRNDNSKRPRCGASDQDQAIHERLTTNVQANPNEIEDNILQQEEISGKIDDPHGTVRELVGARVPFTAFKYMGGFNKEKSFNKDIQFFDEKFLGKKNSRAKLLRIFPIKCPSVINYTIAGVKGNGVPGTHFDRVNFTETLGRRANLTCFEISTLQRPWLTFRRRVEGDRCILCNRKFKKLYYLLIHYNTCYPRLDFTVSIPENLRELRDGFEIIISQNRHYNLEHYEDLPFLPGEVTDRTDPHFFMTPFDSRMMRDHVYLDLTTFIAGFDDTERLFIAIKHPIRFCDYYYHKKFLEISGIDHQTGVLQLLWIEFVYTLSVETCRKFTPYVLYRVFIHLRYQELHDLRLLPAMGNHIQYYTKKRIISRKLGRDIVDRLSGRKKVKQTKPFDVLFKKLLVYFDVAKKRHDECTRLYSYQTFLNNPIEPNTEEVEILAESVLSFPFNLLEDTKYSIVSQVFNLAQKLNQRTTYGLFYETLTRSR